MSLLLFPFKLRNAALTVSLVLTVAFGAALYFVPKLAIVWGPPLVLFGGLTLLGLRDLFQTKHAILRNYPVVAHLRFLLEEIRPELRQYFF